MGIRHQILVTALVVFATAVVLTGSIVYALMQARASTLLIEESLIPQMVATDRMSLLLWESRLNSRSFGLSGNPIYLVRTKACLEKLTDALAANRDLAKRANDDQLMKDLEECQARFYQYQQLIDDTTLTHGHVAAKLALRLAATTDFHRDLVHLRQSAFARLDDSPGDARQTYEQIDRAADHMLGILLTSQRSVDPAIIRPIVSELVRFEHLLQTSFPSTSSLQVNPVIARLSAGSAALRNALVISLVQALKLEALQKARSSVAESFVGLIGQMADRGRGELTGRMAEGSRQLFSMSMLIAVGCGLMLIGALLLTAVLSRSLVRAIGEVSEVAQAMAGGNLNVSLRVRKDDEIGRMAHSLNITIGVLRALINDLAEARDRAISAERAKAQFLANMSHEIRTPLNVIMGLTGVHLELPLPAEQREDLHMVYTSAQDLLRIMNDILDVSKIEAGQMSLNPESMSIRTTVAEIVRLYLSQAKAKGVSLSYRIAEGVPERILADPGRLRQILMNLLSNALKFTAQGTIDLSVCGPESVSPHRPPALVAEPHDLLRFVLRDTGIGIDPGVLPHLFRPFVQGDGSISRKYGGTGLGLTICRQLCDMMGGSIEVTSVPGTGSTFSFTIRCVMIAESGTVMDGSAGITPPFTEPS